MGSAQQNAEPRRAASQVRGTWILCGTWILWHLDLKAI